MLAKIEFFEVYRVLWVLEFVDTDLEDHHLQIKYFTSIKAASSVSRWPLSLLGPEFFQNLPVDRQAAPPPWRPLWAGSRGGCFWSLPGPDGVLLGPVCV